MKAHASYFLAALLFVPNAASAASAAAANLEIAPTTLELKPGEPGIFYIANRGPRNVDIQIQTMDWHQRGGNDRLSPSDSLFASPAFTKVAPDQRQVVRVMADATSNTREKEYRLLVSEIPRSDEPGGAVRVLLQFSVPVFVSSRAAVRPSIGWSAIRKDDALWVSARNEGSNAIKLLGTTIRAKDSAVPLLVSNLTYILPNATRVWSFDHAPVRNAIRLSARDERSGTDIQTEIPITR